MGEAEALSNGVGRPPEMGRRDLKLCNLTGNLELGAFTFIDKCRHSNDINNCYFILTTLLKFPHICGENWIYLLLYGSTIGCTCFASYTVSIHFYRRSQRTRIRVIKEKCYAVSNIEIKWVAECYYHIQLN